MSTKRKIMLFAIFALLFLASVCVVLYPLVSNLQAEKQKDAIVLAYREAIADDKSMSDKVAAARGYNDALANGRFLQKSSATYYIISFPFHQFGSHLFTPQTDAPPSGANALDKAA